MNQKNIQKIREFIENYPEAFTFDMTYWHSCLFGSYAQSQRDPDFEYKYDGVVYQDEVNRGAIMKYLDITWDQSQELIFSKYIFKDKVSKQIMLDHFNNVLGVN